jgi:hypothetical protein
VSSSHQDRDRGLRDQAGTRNAGPIGRGARPGDGRDCSGRKYRKHRKRRAPCWKSSPRQALRQCAGAPTRNRQSWLPTRAGTLICQPRVSSTDLTAWRPAMGYRSAASSADWRRCGNQAEEAVGGGGRNRTGVHGFAVRCMATLPPRRVPAPRRPKAVKKRGSRSGLPRHCPGAGNEARTRDLNLGKVALYQLSYSRAVADYSVSEVPPETPWH